MSERTNEDLRTGNGQHGPRVGSARSWYEVLELRRDATQQEVEDAYDRAIALIEGRSIGGYLMLDPAAMESARNDVETAFLILSDPIERARFDAELERNERGSPPLQKVPEPVSAEGEPVNAEAVNAEAEAVNAEAEAVNAEDETAGVDGEAESAEGEPEHGAMATEPPHARKTPLRILAPVEAPEPERAPEPPRPALERPRIRIASRPVTEEVSDPRPAHAVEPPRENDGSELPADGEINGQVIRRLREARGVSIAELSEATKISKSYLTAIEEQNLDDLPARVYLRGFLTQVARVLKVDRTRLAEGYLAFVERYRRK